MELRRLELKDEEAFREAISSWDNSPGFEFVRGFDSEMKFSDYLDILNKQERGEDLPEGWVPDTSLFGFIDDDQIVGRLSLRHSIETPFLRNFAGHIGYGVLDKHRNNGFATKMLGQSLENCRDLKLTKILITCDENNTASKKVIEKCGGVFEDKRLFENKIYKLRYWIKL